MYKQLMLGAVPQAKEPDRQEPPLPEARQTRRYFELLGFHGVSWDCAWKLHACDP